MNRMHVLLAAGVLALLVAYLGRYELDTSSDGRVAFRLDRWTGEVIRIYGYEGLAVEIKR